MRLAQARFPLVLLVLASAAALGGCPFDSQQECLDESECWDPADTGTGAGGTGGSSGGGGVGGEITGGGGSGGTEPCGGTCVDPTPLCDTGSGTCVACLGHGDCTDPVAARCENGSCVGCQDSSECVGVVEGQICDNEVCVECTVDDSSACPTPANCDLINKTCTGAEAGTVGICEACTNDLQCAEGACIELDYQGAPHGAYCLRQPPPSCARPFSVGITSASINGAAEATYCGISEDNATCEAVLALQAGWVCSGTDGMCSPDGIQPEVAVPGAVCEQVDVLPDQCTYACAGVQQCPLAIATCGTGAAIPPGWCGG